MTNRLIEPGERFLDIGCGNGSMLRKVKDRYQELYEVDIAPSRLEEAKEKIEELYPSDILKFKFIEGNADNPLPFPDNYFDAIICVAVIEHVYDIFFLVKEIYRILKPEGYVIAQVPNICYLKYRIQFLLGKLPATSNPYAVDDEFFFKCCKRYKKKIGQIKKQLEVGHNKIILYIGQLIERKRVIDLLKAFKLLKKEIQNVSLLIIGSGPIETELRQYCRENKLVDVLFMGFKQKDELLKYYATADIFVLPSSNEVWGLVINEAMACGLPIITTNQVGASGDIVKNGVNGYIIEPKDSEMLSKKMLKILKNDNLKEQMGQRSRQIIEDWGIKQELNGTLKAINYIQRK